MITMIIIGHVYFKVASKVL